MAPTEFHSIFSFYGKSVGAIILGDQLFQNILFCVQQNKETHTGLEQHEGGEIILG